MCNKICYYIVLLYYRERDIWSTYRYKVDFLISGLLFIPPWSPEKKENQDNQTPDLQALGSENNVRGTYPICFQLVPDRLRAVCCNLLLRLERDCTRIQLFPGNCSGNPQRFALCETRSHTNSLITDKAKGCVFVFQTFLLSWRIFSIF